MAQRLSTHDEEDLTDVEPLPSPILQVPSELPLESPLPAQPPREQVPEKERGREDEGEHDLASSFNKALGSPREALPNLPKGSLVAFPQLSSSPRFRHHSLSRQSSLHSNFSEAAGKSSTANSPSHSPLPFVTSPLDSASNLHRHQVAPENSGAKKSRHPSFSYHGLEGKGSTGAAVQKPDNSEAKIVVAMVGLPARGKSYLSNKLQRYLKWLEFNVKVFNVGQYRRDKYRKLAAESGQREDQSANFFDPHNQSASQVREQLAAECLESLISWLKADGNVGIHDATNSTKARRNAIVERLKKERGIKLIFLESICTDPSVIQANIDIKVASGDPDYDGMPKEMAKEDFLRRIRHYETSYETVDDENLSYCKIVNVGYEVTINRIDNYLASRVAFYLMNLHVTPRSIFFTRHGESQFNVEGKIGGDSCLSPRGMQYAEALPKLIADAIGDTPLTVWTSTLKRTIQTAKNLPYPKLTWKSLDELDAGVCDGMTYEEIEEHYPEDYAQRDDDKFNYRYRGGESYRDVVVRLEPVIMELERQENILIVCHQAVLRCLYAYFHNFSQDELPYLKIPLHTVIKLTPKAYGCDEERYTLPIEAVDTTRPKPVKALQSSTRVSGDGPSPSTRPPPGSRPLYS